MCGRYSFGKTDRVDWGRFGVPAVPDPVPNWNIAPGTSVLAVRSARDARTEANGPAGASARECVALRWGLIPGWARDAAIGSRLFNARAESAHEKPAFREAFKARRCVLPADGFYEWQTVAGQKTRQPWRVEPADGGFLALGALWEWWRGPEQDVQETCVILTVPVNAALRHIHDRMPLLIAAHDLATWLAPETPAALVRALCVSAADNAALAWRVSPAINAARNNDPTVAAPLPG